MSDKEIRWKRQRLEKCILRANQTMVFEEFDKLVALYEKEIEVLGGSSKVRKDEFRNKMKYYFREMSRSCDEIAGATDNRIEKTYERVFHTGQ